MTPGLVQKRPLRGARFCHIRRRVCQATPSRAYFSSRPCDAMKYLAHCCIGSERGAATGEGCGVRATRALRGIFLGTLPSSAIPNAPTKQRHIPDSVLTIFTLTSTPVAPWRPVLMRAGMPFSSRGCILGCYESSSRLLRKSLH